MKKKPKKTQSAPETRRITILTRCFRFFRLFLFFASRFANYSLNKPGFYGILNFEGSEPRYEMRLPQLRGIYGTRRDLRVLRLPRLSCPLHRVPWDGQRYFQGNLPPHETVPAG